MFEQSTRTKLRFQTSKGLLSGEDLFDLPLISTRSLDLNTVAKSIAKALRENSEDNFVGEQTPENATLTLQLAIVKRVIEIKQQEKLARDTAEAERTRKATVRQFIAEKKNDALKSLSIEELEKLL